MSEKTGEQMASEDPRLQEMIRRAARDAAYDLTLAFTLGAEAGIRWSAERIAGGGACETEKACKTCPACGVGRIYTVNDECEVCGATEKPASEPKTCLNCSGYGVYIVTGPRSTMKVLCDICGGTGKAKE